MDINPLSQARQQTENRGGSKAIDHGNRQDSRGDEVTLKRGSAAPSIDPQALRTLFEEQQFSPFIAKDGPVCDAVQKRIDEKKAAHAWTFDMKGRNFDSFENFPDGDLLVEAEGEFYRIDANRGGVIWNHRIEGMTSSDYPKQILKDGTMFVKHGSSLCRIDGETGAILWDKDFKGNYSFHQITPLENGDYIVHYCTTLYGIDGDTGKTKWEHKYGNLDDIHYGEQALPDGPVYMVIAKIPCYPPPDFKPDYGDPRSVLVALDPDTGKEIPGFNKIKNVTAKRVAKDGIIYFREGDEVGAARLDGKEIYRASIPVAGKPFPILEPGKNGILYATGSKGTTALSKEGTVLWEVPESNGVTIPPEDPEIVFTKSLSRTYIRNAQTGEKRWATTGSILRVKKDLVFCAEADKLSAVDTSTGVPRWEVKRPFGYDGLYIDEKDVIYTFAARGQKHTISATDPATGNEKWSLSIGDSDTSLHKSLSKNGRLYVSDQAHIWEINTEDGRVTRGIRYEPAHLYDMKINPDETGLIIRDGMGNLQIIPIDDFSDVEEELLAAENEFKESVIGDGTCAAGDSQASIDEDEDFVNIDGIVLERRKPS